MVQSFYIGLPKLSGPLLVNGPWGGFFVRPDYRIAPYSIGAMVRVDSLSTTAFLHGLGELAVNDYVLACAAVNFGGADYFVPDVARISRVSALSGVNDEVTLTVALALQVGEYLLNLEADGAVTPLIAPNYDGSDVAIYVDPVGTNLSANPYLVTGTGGRFQGWVNSGISLVDILILDGSGNPRIAVPHYTLGAEIGV